MKTNLFLSIFSFVAMIFMGACSGFIGIDGNGNVVSETRDVESFDEIHVGGAFKVILVQGDSEGLSIEADENLLPMIKTSVRGNKLIINTSETIGRARKLNLYVSFRELKKLDVSGACDVVGEGMLHFSSLEIEGSGASEIDLSLEADLLRFDCSGAAEIDLSGSSNQCTIEISGAADVDAFDLLVKQMEIRASGAADLRVHATESLKVNASGAASVVYRGNPNISQSISGAGSVRQEN